MYIGNKDKNIHRFALSVRGELLERERESEKGNERKRERNREKERERKREREILSNKQ